MSKETNSKPKGHLKSGDKLASSKAKPLKSSLENYNIKELVNKDLEKRLLGNELESIKFYDIPVNPLETNKPKGVFQFHSLNNFADSVQMKSMKLYKKPTYSELELDVIKSVKKQNGTTLLLSEIYEQLSQQIYEEESGPEKQLSHAGEKVSKTPIYESEKEDVLGLEAWKKKVNDKAALKKQRDLEQAGIKLPRLQNVKNQRSEYIIDASSSPKASKVSEGENEVKKNIKDSIKVNKFLLRLNSLKDVSDNSTEKKVLNYLEGNISLPADSILAAKEKAKEKGQGKQFAQKEMEKEKLVLDEKKEEEALYKLENIKKIIFTVFHYQFEPNSKVDKVEFYERQATLIDDRLCKKMREFEAMIGNKTNSLRLIRLENSKIIDKMSKIKNLNKAIMEMVEIDTQAISGFVSFKEKSNGRDSEDFKANGSSSSIMDSQIMEKSKRGTIAPKRNVIEKSREIQERLEEVRTLKESYGEFKKKLHFNEKIVDELEAQVRGYRREFKLYKKEKVEFYFEELRLGLDVRNEGLSWIIRLLWSLGERIFENHLPKFLDTKAKEFLFIKAKKELELIEIETLDKSVLEMYKMNVNSKSREKEIQDILDKSLINAELKQEIKSQMGIFDAKEDLKHQHFSFQDTDHDHDIDFIKDKSMIIIGENSRELDQSLFPKIKKEDPSQVQDIDMNKILVYSTRALSVPNDENERRLKKLIYQSKISSNMFKKKFTSNDLVYNKAKDKIKDLLTPLYENSQAKSMWKENSSINIEVPTSHNFENNIVLIEDTSIVNGYTSREEFIREYELLRKKYADKQKELKNLKEEEVRRMIREFDFKSYETRFSVDSATVLYSLVGRKTANMELIRYGMVKK